MESKVCQTNDDDFQTNEYKYDLDQFVEQRLSQLNKSSHENALHLSQVQETIQSAVDHISAFLFNQVDFEAVHREAMLKVHRDELSEQQKQPLPV